MKGYRIKINSQILNEFVFGMNSKRFLAYGLILEIQTDIFLSFYSLENVYIGSHNMKSLFSRNPNWMTNFRFQTKLNNNSYLKLSIEVHLISNYFPVYSYPNEDLCLFKNVPLKKLLIFEPWNFEEKVIIKY